MRRMMNGNSGKVGVVATFVTLLVVVVALLSGSIEAKDPATSWLGYAKAVNPANTGIITYVGKGCSSSTCRRMKIESLLIFFFFSFSKTEAKWVVLDEPKVPGAYVTPWFGIESSENMNLIQPVNPWNMNYWEVSEHKFVLFISF